jgi:uncharacterized protein YjbJ (UPF0337 family)
MITRQELEGHWNTVKGQIQEKWGQLTDDDLMRVKGDANQLVGVIQTKTGETRRAIEAFLDEAVAGGASAVQQAVGTAKEYAGQAATAAKEYAGQAATAAKDYAGQAAQAARQGYDMVSANVSEGYGQAQDMVRRNPMESVAVAFGAGLIAGVVTGLVLKSR